MAVGREAPGPRASVAVATLPLQTLACKRSQAVVAPGSEQPRASGNAQELCQVFVGSAHRPSEIELRQIVSEDAVYPIELNALLRLNH
jgi:hypothetical protein